MEPFSASASKAFTMIFATFTKISACLTFTEFRKSASGKTTPAYTHAVVSEGLTRAVHQDQLRAVFLKTNCQVTPSNVARKTEHRTYA